LLVLRPLLLRLRLLVVDRWKVIVGHIVYRLVGGQVLANLLLHGHLVLLMLFNLIIAEKMASAVKSRLLKASVRWPPIRLLTQWGRIFLIIVMLCLVFVELLQLVLLVSNRLIELRWEYVVIKYLVLLVVR
jgi:hypothetical protein